MKMSEPRKTSLYNIHQKYGGKIVNYAGWALPVEFEGILAEHEAVRNQAGLFDVSHMGEIEIKGNEAENFLQYLFTNDINFLRDNQIAYTFMCDPDGGVIDDLLVYKFKDDHFFLVVNAGNTEKDYKWIIQNIGAYDVVVRNVSDDFSQIALQGPKSEGILQKLTVTDLSEIGFYYCKRNVNIAGANCLISRTGYTGEDGFEIYLAHKDAELVWEKLMEAGQDEGIRPVGLGARDTLRFEVGLPLYGNELSEEITPLEAGLGFFVKLSKPNFIGKEALEKQKIEGLKRKLVGFEMVDKGVPRHGYEVLSEGENIGFVTTGYYSPSLKKNIGLALVDSEYGDIGTTLFIKVRKRILEAKVINKKFYNKKYKK
jgi:aminomethyltransferase